MTGVINTPLFVRGDPCQSFVSELLLPVPTPGRPSQQLVLSLRSSRDCIGSGPTTEDGLQKSKKMSRNWDYCNVREHRESVQNP